MVARIALIFVSAAAIEMWLSQKRDRTLQKTLVVGCKFFKEVFMRSMKILFLRFLAVLPLAGIAFAVFVMIFNSSKNGLIRIGFPDSWGTLKPALQHTVFADVILGNVYEPLARTTSRGTLRPCAARSWSVSEDRRLYTFKIDTTRRFSDGTQLTARHFKDSWEHGLALTPKSANSSLADVLYKVVGAEAFEQTRSLAGVRILDDETLQVEFQTPFRMALEHLAGIRYSAVLYKGDNELGTGPYRFVSHSETEVHFERNPYAPKMDVYEKAVILKVSIDEAKRALTDNVVDAYHDFGRGLEAVCDLGENVKCLAGLESGHEEIDVNGMQGRLFAEPKMRLALQSLLFRNNSDGVALVRKGSSSFRIDAQSFLMLQAGRLADAETENLVEAGAPYIPELIEATKRRPITAYTNRSTRFIDALKYLGLSVSERSGVIDFKETLNICYKTYDADLLHGSFSVASGDPDGIYHVLGKEGAISSPMIQRPAVMELLEEGRKILKLEDLPSHYQKVSRAILTEVPYIHIGFRIAQIAYRSDRVRLNEAVKGRDDDDIILYEPL